MAKTRRVPMRTCVACGATRPKRELVRVVRTPTGEVVVDSSGRTAGRGAYVCPQPECLERALGGHRLDRHLHRPVGEDLRPALEAAVTAAREQPHVPRIFTVPARGGTVSVRAQEDPRRRGKGGRGQ